MRLIDRLRSLGVDVSLEEVEAKGAAAMTGRPHFARVLIEKGYVATIEQAFEQLSGRIGEGLCGAHGSWRCRKASSAW